MLERSRSVFLGNKKGKYETAIWTAKLMLISIGTVSIFLLFKIALIPFIFDSIVPRCHGCLRACLSPPYIYIIVNFIIISIAASSSTAEKSTSEENEVESNYVEPQDVKLSAKLECDGAGLLFSSDDHVETCYNEVCDSTFDMEAEDLDAEEVVKGELASSDSFLYSENCPPQDGEDDDYHDNLDATWKAIMEGKGTVKKPFLIKSDTWNDTRAPPTLPLVERVSNYQKPEMRKSETFNDRVTTLRAGGAVRRETLISSYDSLNARVEAFINKFNNDMRMERQQSDMKHMNMVKLKQAAAT